MRITFLGAAQEVGKSSVLVESGVKLVLDAGIKVHGSQEIPNYKDIKADAVILSHAHLDHTGAAPALYKHHPIPCFATFPTLPLISLLYEDSEKIALLNKQSLPFGKQDVKRLIEHAVALPYEQTYTFYEGTSFEFLDAGHILGSAQTLLRSQKKTLLYTGDFNVHSTRLHAGALAPKEKVDVLITESTYGNREHKDRKSVEEEFCDQVEKALDLGKTVLCPAFAIGRAQELLLTLNANRLANEVCIDGMAKAVCTLMTEYPSYIKNAKALKDALSSARFIETDSQRKAAAKKPGIILSTAGMLDGGPALSYLKRISEKDKGVVFLTGYQVEGSNGRNLLEGKPVRFGSEKKKIALPVKQFDFSAHSSKSELIAYAKKVNPEKIFCIHGDSEACTELAGALKEEGFEAVAPAVNQKFEI